MGRLLKMGSPVAAAAALTLFSGGIARARWATPADMDYSVEYRHWKLDVHKDGTYDELMEDEVTVLRDSARMSRGVVRIDYNPEVSRYEILVAETLNGKTRLKVPRRLIEDKPLASPGEGFDQWHQIMIAFPGVDVGSRLHLKLRARWTRVPSPGFFSTYLYYGSEIVKSEDVTIRSALPLLEEVNDPRHELQIHASPHVLRVSVKNPALRAPVDERDPLVPPEDYATVAVASSRDWGAIARSAVPKYEEIVNAPLPETFRAIADAARGIADPVARMNAVTSRLADEIRYLGDWRTLKGQWVPRPLATIARSKFGDCKDFAASVTAILRRLGFKADVAWVYRSWIPDLASYAMPDQFRFNHAIARAEYGGKVYWLDGTNIASFAQGTPGDIADRPALVLDPAGPALERVTTPPYGERSYAFSEKLDFSSPDAIQMTGRIASFGADSASWINSSYSASQDSLDFKVAHGIARSDQIRDWKVSGFNLKSRIAGELDASVSYVDPMEGYRSTAGTSYPIPTPDGVEKLLVPSATRVSAYYLGQPFSFKREMLLTHLDIVGSEPLGCTVDSPWISVKRDVASVDDGIRVTDSVALKKALLRAEDYRTPEFAALQKKLASCFRFSSLIYRPKQKRGLP